MFYRGVLFFLLFSFLIGCSGVAPLLSKSEHPIAIALFENATEEPLLALHVTSTLKDVFIRRGILIVSDARAASNVLSGKINKFEQVFLSLNTNGQASESRVTVGMEYIVSRGATPSQPQSINASADYLNNSDPSQDRTAKDRAIREASFRLAEKVADEIEAVSLLAAS